MNEHLHDHAPPAVAFLFSLAAIVADDLTRLAAILIAVGSFCIAVSQYRMQRARFQWELEERRDGRDRRQTPEGRKRPGPNP